MKEYHAAWVQLLEQGWTAWGDDIKNAQLCRLMVWSKAALSSKVSSNTVMTATPHPASQGVMIRGCYGYVSVPSKPGDRAYTGFNRFTCPSNASHPTDLHVCAYCLYTVHKFASIQKPSASAKEVIKKSSGEGGGERATAGCLPPPPTLTRKGLHMKNYLDALLDITYTTDTLSPPNPALWVYGRITKRWAPVSLHWPFDPSAPRRHSSASFGC